MSFTLRLEDELDISRGELICHPDELPSVARELRADVCWMAAGAAAPGLRATCSSTPRAARRRSWTSIDDLRRRAHARARASRRPSSQLNDIGRVRLRTSAPLVFDPYTSNRRTGSFILIDEASNATVGAGMIAAADS